MRKPENHPLAKDAYKPNNACWAMDGSPPSGMHLSKLHQKGTKK